MKVQLSLLSPRTAGTTAHRFAAYKLGTFCKSRVSALLKVTFKFGAAALNVTHFKYYFRDLLNFLPE